MGSYDWASQIFTFETSVRNRVKPLRTSLKYQNPMECEQWPTVILVGKGNRIKIATCVVDCVRQNGQILMKSTLDIIVHNICR
jgi:hypothetical protein